MWVWIYWGWLWSVSSFFRSVAKEFSQNIVIGDAADYAFLKSTIFFEASAVLVTTHNDDINIYLSLYFRKLRPDIQLLARANNESNVASLHRAGADFVLSRGDEPIPDGHP